MADGALTLFSSSYLMRVSFCMTSASRSFYNSSFSLRPICLPCLDSASCYWQCLSSFSLRASRNLSSLYSCMSTPPPSLPLSANPPYEEIESLLVLGCNIFGKPGSVAPRIEVRLDYCSVFSADLFLTISLNSVGIAILFSFSIV